MHRRSFILGSTTALLAATTARGADRGFVDTAIVLSHDASKSIDDADRLLQVEGLFNAFTNDDVLDLIQSGRHGAIAVAVTEWADEATLLVDWHKISSAVDAQKFIESFFSASRENYGSTDIYTGAIHAIGQFDRCPWSAERKVIDIAGDGYASVNGVGVRKNDEPAFLLAQLADMKTQAEAAGITINGLTIKDKEAPLIDSYYKKYVICGPSAFTVSIDDFREYSNALVAKLIRELA
jgi:hypothetical protein